MSVATDDRASGTGRVRNILLNPDTFYETRATDISLRYAIAVVLLAGAIFAAGPLIIIARVTTNLDSSVTTFAYLGSFVSSFFYFGSVIVMWFVNCGVFYTISSFFDGDGSFRTLFKYTGLGYVPTVLSAVIVSIALYYIAHQTPPPASVADVVQFRRKLTDDSMYVAAKLSAAFFEIWRGFLWVFAVKHARGLTSKRAVLTVGVPVTLSLSWTLANVAGIP